MLSSAASPVGHACEPASRKSGELKPGHTVRLGK